MKINSDNNYLCGILDGIKAYSKYYASRIHENIIVSYQKYRTPHNSKASEL
ncbi:hypothetical protein BH18THE2_BH18THE2_33890 [soil metagenome]